MTGAMIDFEALFGLLPTPFMVLDRDLRFVEMNEAYLRTTQRSREDLLGRYVFDAFPEKGERLARFERALKAALAGEANTLVKVPFSVARPASDGGGLREVWWTCSHVPVLGADGTSPFMVQHAQDVTAQVEAERVKEVVEGELQHRVRNIFAMVTTIARRTAEYEGDMAGFIASFTARLNALVETNDLLTGGDWDGTELGELVRLHLKVYADDGDLNVRIEGPELRLSARDAQSLSMAVHELATNAAKYGALKTPGARVTVAWSRIGRSGYRFEWREEGLSDLAAPSRKGFGSLILARFLPAQLEGEAEQRFEPTGYVYRLTVPGSDDGAAV